MTWPWIDPTTSRSQSGRSTSLATSHVFFVFFFVFFFILFIYLYLFIYLKIEWYVTCVIENKKKNKIKIVNKKKKKKQTKKQKKTLRGPITNFVNYFHYFIALPNRVVKFCIHQKMMNTKFYYTLLGKSSPTFGRICIKFMGSRVSNGAISKRMNRLEK